MKKEIWKAAKLLLVQLLKLDINGQLAREVDYLKAENQVLKSQIFIIEIKEKIRQTYSLISLDEFLYSTGSKPEKKGSSTVYDISEGKTAKTAVTN